MALVSCKECDYQISDKAILCVKCGAPLPGMTDEELVVDAKRAGYLQNRWVAGLPFWFGVFWLVLPMLSGGNSDDVTMAWGLSKWFIGFGFILYVVGEIERNLYERKLKKSAVNE